MTTDAWVWRGQNYRADLNLASNIPGSRVLASASGIAKAHQLTAGEYVVYCPESGGRFNEQQLGHPVAD